MERGERGEGSGIGSGEGTGRGVKEKGTASLETGNEVAWDRLRGARGQAGERLVEVSPDRCERVGVKVVVRTTGRWGDVRLGLRL